MVVLSRKVLLVMVGAVSPEPVQGGRFYSVFSMVVVDIAIAGLDAPVVLGLERRELHREVVAQLQARVTSEVGKGLALLLAHVVAVLLPGTGHCLPPRIAADLEGTDLGGGVPDLVVVMDRVAGLPLGAVLAARAGTQIHQTGVEQLLLRRRMLLQQDLQPFPDRRHRCCVGPVDVVEHGQHPPLLVVVAQDQFSGVYGRNLSADTGLGERKR